MFKSNGRKLALALVATAVVSMLAACGGGADAPAAPVQATVASPDPTLVPTAAPPKAPPTVPSKAPPKAPPTVPPTLSPTVPPTVVPIATPEPSTVFDEFGFSLGLDRGAEITNLPGNTATQGMTQLGYSGVNAILSWVPINGVTTEALVSGMFGMLQDNQPDLILDTVSESSFNVGLESGLVVGFRSVDGAGKVVGGGLIGAWNCLDTEVSFTLAVTGDDANIVQLRFNRLINNFACA